MNLFSTLWITFGIVLIGLTHLKVDRKNLKEINHVVKYKEVFTQAENVNNTLECNKVRKSTCPQASPLYSMTKQSFIA